ncbi:MAG: hypothetical protein QM727_08350 [Niabella sp.]
MKKIIIALACFLPLQAAYAQTDTTDAERNVIPLAIASGQSDHSQNAATLASQPDHVLPFDFGFLNAKWNGKQLIIDWSSLAETDNVHFEIQASKDGNNFIPIGTVNSKAANGSSTTEINYSFSLALPGTLAGFSLLFAALFVPAFSKNKRINIMFALLCIASCYFSCSKQNADVNDEVNKLKDFGKIYVRVARVDKNDAKYYSKIVQVVKE